MTFYKYQHRGGIKEAWETRKQISQKQFNELLPRYHVYAVDNRIKCIDFLANDMENEEYAWIAIKVNKNEITEI